MTPSDNLNTLRMQAMNGDRDAMLGVMRNTDDPQQLRSWALLLVTKSLNDLKVKGVRSAQLSAGTAIDRLCPACQALDGKIIPTTASAVSVIPYGCTCTRPGMLMIHGWIKHYDGSEGVDGYDILSDTTKDSTSNSGTRQPKMSDNTHKTAPISSADEWHKYQAEKKRLAAEGKPGEPATDAPVELMPVSSPLNAPKVESHKPKKHNRFRAEKGQYNLWHVGKLVFASESDAKRAVAEARWTLMVWGVMAGVLLLIAAGVTRCVNSEPSREEQAKMTEIKAQRYAREQVKALLKDPGSAEFRNQKGLCGEVNSKNSFGAYTGYQRFIVSKTVVIESDPDLPDGLFREVWGRICK